MSAETTAHAWLFTPAFRAKFEDVRRCAEAVAPDLFTPTHAERVEPDATPAPPDPQEPRHEVSPRR